MLSLGLFKLLIRLMETNYIANNHPFFSRKQTKITMPTFLEEGKTIVVDTQSDQVLGL
jgi:hypothetical protein